MTLSPSQVANVLYYKCNVLKKFEAIEAKGGKEMFEGEEHEIPPRAEWNNTATVLAVLYVCGAHPGAKQGMQEEELEQVIKDYDLLNL